MAKKKPPRISVLIKLAEEAGLRLFHTRELECYGIFPVAGVRQVWPLESRQFAWWLLRLFHTQKKGYLRGNELGDSIRALQSKAIYDCSEEKVWLRTAKHDGSFWIDLVNDKWQAVRIDRHGWEIADKPPVYFVRKSGMSPLPTPDRGGDISGLEKYFNLEGFSDWRLLKAWWLQSLLPVGPYPICLLYGPQGSAKTTTIRFVRKLLDPSIAWSNPEPKEIRDLMIMADNSWLCVFDNLSKIDAWLSDALCRMATGGGYRTRKLFTDKEEAIFSAMRPVCITSIADITHRSDFMERCVLVNQPPLRAADRKLLAALESDYDNNRERYFGGLLHQLAEALDNLEFVSKSNLPRLADFAILGRSLSFSEDADETAFDEAMKESTQDAQATIMEANSFVRYLREHVRAWNEWEGTANMLLEALNCLKGQDPRPLDWPKTDAHLSRQLRMLLPALYDLGITVQFRQQDGARLIKLCPRE